MSSGGKNGTVACPGGSEQQGTRQMLTKQFRFKAVNTYTMNEYIQSCQQKRDECLKREIEREKRAGGVVLDGL